MKLIFPTNEDKGHKATLGAHFGRAKYYTVVTLTGGMVINVESVANPGHGGGCKDAVQNILNLRPDALVVSGIGAKPAAGFVQAGVKLYRDSRSDTVAQSVKAFADGMLESAGARGTCSSH